MQAPRPTNLYPVTRSNCTSMYGRYPSGSLFLIDFHSEWWSIRNWKKLSLQFGPLGGWLRPVIEPKIGPPYKSPSLFSNPRYGGLKAWPAGVQIKTFHQNVPEPGLGGAWLMRQR